MTDQHVYEPLFSRRIWEFDTDEIRLSAMSNTRFLGHIQNVFNFDRAEIDRPVHTDRQRRPVWPPGLVFELGVGPVNLDTSESNEADEVAFRRFSIEADRITIEVTGSTNHADQLMEYIAFLLSEMRTPEGAPYIGTPARVKDFSLVVIRNAGASIMRLIQPTVTEVINRHFGLGENSALLPELSFQAGQQGEPVSLSERSRWIIKPRFGTPPERGILESHAWLSSDDHILMLQDIHASLSTHR